MYKSFYSLGSEEEKKQDQYAVVELQDFSHKMDTLNRNRVVCIDIYADWCGPCKQTAPRYALVASKHHRQGVCAVVKYNLDRMSPQEKEKIQSVPTFQFYVDGRQVDEMSGANIDAVEGKIVSILSDLDKSSSQPALYNKSSIRAGRSSIPSMTSISEEYQY